MKLRKYTKAMFLRTHVADATLPDGRKIEVSNNMAGGDLIGIVYAASGKSGATYVLSAQDFVREILACEAGEAEFEVAEEKEKVANEDKT
jgi:hypothetical protein